METTLYKTTAQNGDPIHGGSGAWPLPQNGEPGAWRDETGHIEKCRRGLHLTGDPAQWWEPGCRVWVAEAEGVVGSCDDDADRKVVCRRARLVREVTDAAELATLRIFVSGSHEVKAGHAVAYGSASVRASGSASVRAYGSASVEAYGSASVRAYDGASVRATDAVTVVSWRGRPGVRVDKRAIWIDRSNDPQTPAVHTAQTDSEEAA